MSEINQRRFFTDQRQRELERTIMQGAPKLFPDKIIAISS